LDRSCDLDIKVHEGIKRYSGDKRLIAR